MSGAAPADHPASHPAEQSLADRRRAVVLAGHRRDLPAATRAWADLDGGVRALAIGALERVDALTTELLAAALDDPDARVRRRAVTVAATRDDVSLLAVLDDPDPVVAEHAAWACGERTPPEPGAVDALIRLASGAPEALVREAAVAALGAIGDPAGQAAVLAAMDDKVTVRRRAVLALAAFDGDDVLDALRRAVDDRDWQVRQGAADLLVIVDGDTVDDDTVDDS